MESPLKKESFIKRLSRRKWQLIISIIGTILIVPWCLFLGVMFTFAFRSDESRWAWAFDLIAFWSQIPGVLFSFLKPRLSALWMLLCVGVSMLMGIGFEIKSAYAPNARHLSSAEWISDLPILLKESFYFWGLPVVVALLLLTIGRQPIAKNNEHIGH